MGRSSFVVVVPEAEPVVAPFRARYDTMAERGVPAHVTVLAFRPVVDREARGTAESVAAGLAPFDAWCDDVGRFDDGALFLAPEPRAAFRLVTDALAAAFPDCAPALGPFPDPVPHLTVARHLEDATAAAVADDLRAGLPLHWTVTSLTLLLEDDDGRWIVDAAWPLLGGLAGG